MPTFGPRMVCTRCGIIGADARQSAPGRAKGPSGPSYHSFQFGGPMCRHPKIRAKQVLRDVDVGLLLVGVVVPDKIEERKRYNRITVQGLFASTNSLDICCHRAFSSLRRRTAPPHGLTENRGPQPRPSVMQKTTDGIGGRSSGEQQTVSDQVLNLCSPHLSPPSLAHHRLTGLSGSTPIEVHRNPPSLVSGERLGLQPSASLSREYIGAGCGGAAKAVASRS